MQRHLGLSIVASMIALAALFAGCAFTFDTGDCADFPGPGCLSGSSVTGSGGAGGSSATSTATMGGGGGGTNCDPTLGQVDDSCGIFVSLTGDDTAAGDKAHPLQTLSAAIFKSDSQRVYACAEEFVQITTLEVPAGTSIYGGLSCTAGWSWLKGELTKIMGPLNVVAVSVTKGAPQTSLFDLEITAPPASSPGSSSIALIVEQAPLELVRVTLTAGDGKAGAPGSGGGAALPTAPSGVAGSPSAPYGQGSVSGGTGAVNVKCGLGGGKGGDGGNAPGAVGNPGIAGDGGNGGAGENAALCTEGGPGGVIGTAGSDGLAGKGYGSLDLDGYHGNAGIPGGDGSPGRSGGGGGGSKANAAAHGAGGGGGGAQGCGGIHGLGGAPGGASIALASINANVVLQDSILKAGIGGDGGQGGPGQPGQTGGPLGAGGNGSPAVGINPGCDGGPGSAGGNGGGGGGGVGGHSLGIAFTKIAPVRKGMTMVTPGMAGAGGLGGGANPSQHQGDSGTALGELELN